MGADISGTSSLSQLFTYLDGLTSDSPLLHGQYRQICHQNRPGIHALLVKGYGAEQSRIRDMDSKCAHHKFGSSSAFIAHIQQLNRDHRRCIENQNYRGQEQIGNVLHELFNVGFCKKCALFVSVHFRELMKNRRNVLHLSVGKMGTQYKVKTTSSFSWDIEEYLNGAHNMCLLIPCMQYMQCNYFILNQSTLWTANLLNEMYTMIFSLHRASAQIIDGEIDRERHLQLIGHAFRVLAIHLFQIIRNLSSWKQDHWLTLLTSKCDHYPLEMFMEFVALQLEHELYKQFQYGWETMYCMLMLICCAVHQMRMKWFKQYQWKIFRVYKYNVTKLRRWCRKLKKKQWPKLESTLLVLSFAYLDQKLCAENMYLMIREHLMEVRKLKWLDMQCQRGECSARRSSRSLRKCAGCQVVRYCSRKCQKREWKAHKPLCQRLASFQRERSIRQYYQWTIDCLECM